MDVAAAGRVVQAALGMGAGRRMSIRCVPLVHKVLNVVGAADVPHLRVVVTDDD